LELTDEDIFSDLEQDGVV